LKKVDRLIVDQIVTGGIFYMGREIADEVYPNRPLADNEQPEFCILSETTTPIPFCQRIMKNERSDPPSVSDSHHIM
jgi:hypothetical protein